MKKHLIVLLLVFVLLFVSSCGNNTAKDSFIGNTLNINVNTLKDRYGEPVKESSFADGQRIKYEFENIDYYDVNGLKMQVLYDTTNKCVTDYALRKTYTNITDGYMTFLKLRDKLKEIYGEPYSIDEKNNEWKYSWKDVLKGCDLYCSYSNFTGWFFVNYITYDMLGILK